MKRPVFLATHMGSGSTDLMHVMVANPRVQCYRTNRVYGSVADLELTTDRPHKCPTRAAVYIDEVVYNHHIQDRRILDVCKFVYVVREPLPSLNEVVASRILQPGPALRYYCFRLRRLCEMARRTPGAVLLTWDDVATGRGYPVLEDYLHLKEPLRPRPVLFGPGNRSRGPYSANEVQSAEKAFEKYLAYLRRLDLRRAGD
jgi:hypothetical protein